MILRTITTTSGSIENFELFFPSNQGYSEFIARRSNSPTSAAPTLFGFVKTTI